MTPRWAIARSLTGFVMVCLFGAAVVYSQTAPAGQPAVEKPLLAEDVFKDVQILRGIPAKEFMATMGFFSASLSLNCADCHGEDSGSSWASYAKDTPLKQTTRRMMRMVNALNEANFGGRRLVTCYTCHNGSQRPKAIPSLAAQYGEPLEDPDEVEKVPGVRVVTNPDQVLSRYLEAIGGAQTLAALTSFTATGTYEGFDSDFSKVPVDIYAKAPDTRTTIVHMKGGDSTSVFNGRDGWSAGPAALVPVPVLPLLGADLEAARLDAFLSFPGQIRQQLTGWSGGFPALTIDDRPVDVIEARTPGALRAKLYFDKQTGLLTRQVRYTQTAVGIVSTHITYSDYRPVSGVKMPFQWQVTWVNGQYTVNLTSVQPNVPIDAARFARPQPPR